MPLEKLETLQVIVTLTIEYELIYYNGQTSKKKTVLILSILRSIIQLLFLLCLPWLISLNTLKYFSFLLLIA